MPKITKVQTLDANGSALAGQVVKITGCPEMGTNTLGLTQFLIDEEASMAIAINGAEVWRGSYAELKSTEVFSQSAGGFTRQ